MIHKRQDLARRLAYVVVRVCALLWPVLADGPCGSATAKGVR